MADRLAVIVSRSPSHTSAKCDLDEAIITGLKADPLIEVTVIPHLYHLREPTANAVEARKIQGDLVFLSWLHPRAAHWTLNQIGIRGLMFDTGTEDRTTPSRGPRRAPFVDSRQQHHRVTGHRDDPTRVIYHLDLRAEQDANVPLQKVRHLATTLQHDTDTPAAPIESHTDNDSDRPDCLSIQVSATSGQAAPGNRRWYPVIDFSRCTNCMECIDFCLFGVFGIDEDEAILVEQPDNCRQGCPACSRVCPEQAIIFPHHKTPTISGVIGAAGSGKINLSTLLGAPDPRELAAAERDEHREVSPQQDRSEQDRPADDTEKDELDELIDELDQMDLN